MMLVLLLVGTVPPQNDESLNRPIFIEDVPVVELDIESSNRLLL